MTNETLHTMLLCLEARVKALEDVDKRNARIIELEDSLYKLQRQQYRMASEMRHLEIENYLIKHYG